MIYYSSLIECVMYTVFKCSCFFLLGVLLLDCLCIHLKSTDEVYVLVTLMAHNHDLLFNRCESILQPGNNCTVRIEKNNKLKGRHRRKRSKAIVQNNIVYRCHFCSHQNMMRGTPKGYVKEICPPKPKPAPSFKKVRENHPSSGNATATVECIGMDSSALLPLDGQDLEESSLATPLPKPGLSLLDSKRRKRNRSGVKNVDEPPISSAAADMEKSTQASSKRRKRTWTSLKEIAESGGQDAGTKFTNSTVPFFI